MKLNNNDDSHNSGLNLLIYNMLLDIESHPAWVCGLKQSGQPAVFCTFRHTLRGCVDWNKSTAEGVEIDEEVTPCVGVWIETMRFYDIGESPLSHTLRGCVDWNSLGIEEY